ncbi:hypothetical protein PC116_g21327 [Phytophthora cactorum]|uniref:Uncharacterized protein n=1 Tax=Phytophthora cactorum TaxID=29920 RepID=A0A8T1K541_9STRA|nr:hypothetical protein PC114_g18698 [Phytophthora cactorum]KAG2935917.1 hypothetical protein PC117_g12302 [Phytophthora cactorum]KAG2995034.1 hypothetical protein PC119_g18156 [Phytophthora cactorum]KAG3005894.1 hypothetical protein PC120_g17693 [Phytophthora cactorum]KAG3143155.1 hypothetical protein C6341_g19160 [Phytophthora cactorum]
MPAAPNAWLSGRAGGDSNCNHHILSRLSLQLQLQTRLTKRDEAGNTTMVFLVSCCPCDRRRSRESSSSLTARSTELRASHTAFKCTTDPAERISGAMFKQEKPSSTITSPSIVCSQSLDTQLQAGSARDEAELALVVQSHLKVHLQFGTCFGP